MENRIEPNVKTFQQIRQETEIVTSKHPNPEYALTGYKAFLTGHAETWIQEVYEQIKDNAPRVERALSSTLVFLIKKYKNYGKK